MNIFVLLICKIFILIISIPLIIYLYSFTSRAAKQLIHLQMVKLEYKRYIKDRKRYIKDKEQQKEQER